MLDCHRREVDYLRISVTDRCNLRCRYCMPASGVDDRGHGNILRFEQIVKLVEIGIRAGIRNIRLTGGEPLARQGIVDLIKKIRKNQQIHEITMTTNGILFADMAEELKQAGLTRVNFSLDTLNGEKFHYITRLGDIAPVFKAIDAALALHLAPVKINVVVMRGFNDTEILDFAEMAKRHPVHVRFIEFMPVGDLPFYTESRLMPIKEVRGLIEASYDMMKRPLQNGSGPAKSFMIRGGQGSIGFISAMSDHFCARCNRLRLTADGKLRPCLHGRQEIDMKAAMEENASDERLLRLFQKAVLEKPGRHHMDEGWGGDNGRKMYQIGG